MNCWRAVISGGQKSQITAILLVCNRVKLYLVSADYKSQAYRNCIEAYDMRMYSNFVLIWLYKQFFQMHFLYFSLVIHWDWGILRPPPPCQLNDHKSYAKRNVLCIRTYIFTSSHSAYTASSVYSTTSLHCILCVLLHSRRKAPCAYCYLMKRADFE